MPLSSWRGGSGTAIVKLQGAGASFPAPLYSKWFKAHLPLPAAKPVRA
jgi:ABC-type phosphate transport system substrate-binding protein